MARFRSLAKSSAKPGILTPWSLEDVVDLFEILKSCPTPRIATSILHLTPSNFQMLRWKCEGSTQSKSCSLDEFAEKTCPSQGESFHQQLFQHTLSRSAVVAGSTCRAEVAYPCSAIKLMGRSWSGILPGSRSGITECKRIG